MTVKAQAPQVKTSKFLLLSKRNDQQNEKAAYRMGENISI